MTLDRFSLTARRAACEVALRFSCAPLRSAHRLAWRGGLRLQSGVAGLAASVAKGTSGFDIVTRTHVEGHAAALMRQGNIGEAALYINNPIICSSCTKLLPRMLPPDTRLTVTTPSGSTHFVGIKQ